MQKIEIIAKTSSTIFKTGKRNQFINQEGNFSPKQDQFGLSMDGSDVVEIMDGLSVTVDLWFRLTQFIFLLNISFD